MERDLEKVPRGDEGIAEKEGWRDYFRVRDLEVARREVRGVGGRGGGVNDYDGGNGLDGDGGFCVVQ